MSVPIAATISAPVSDKGVPTPADPRLGGIPGPERCAFLRALGAIRDGALSLVATTVLILGAAWLLRRA
ncbi:MAG: hypothetical protein KHY83_02050 [Coriobacteriia bacterium]|nr:hypothetical protein [Coriobacteriia bacterium]MBS5477435.1 hypothetical protein [Coriobacteriia bacterium]